MTPERRRIWLTAAGVVAVWIAVAALGASSAVESWRARLAAEPGLAAAQAPAFDVDPRWPKPLPNDWILGQVAGVDVDSRDHVWIVHRPLTLTEREAGAVQDPPISECCVPAPPVIEFDADGAVVRAWGGPSAEFHWPESEHGLFVDHEDNIWIGSNGPDDHVVLKFDRDGELLLQIGEAGRTGGSDDTALLGGPADIAVDAEADEVYIADGYVNRRVIVFDATTGEYRRHWGAYGRRPNDDVDPGTYAFSPGAEPARQFRTPVHAVRLSDDRRVYVADRVSNRIQVFRPSGEFVREAFVAPRTLAMGSVWDIELSPDPAQRYVYVPDGSNAKVWVLDREELRVIGSFGRGGRYAGQFNWVHNLAADSEGNLYATEVNTGKRVQKFVPRGTEARN